MKRNNDHVVLFTVSSDLYFEPIPVLEVMVVDRLGWQSVFAQETFECLEAEEKAFTRDQRLPRKRNWTLAFPIFSYSSGKS